jgi:GrpB-like predicted nucleotidyltransferase (UPF0157 family)
MIMIEVVPYRPQWSLEFTALAGDLRRVLGDAALRIDHIGSTAVTGLCAKDVIDVQVTVKSLEPSIAQRLIAARYVAPPGVWQDHSPADEPAASGAWAKLLFRESVGERRANIHIRTKGSPNQRYALLFRDFLRSHGATAIAYGQLKMRLASTLARDDDYPDVKDPATDLIYFAARDWARHSRWELPPPDA